MLESNLNAKIWYALDVTTVTRAREAIEYAVMEAGALGTEVNEHGQQVIITAYFDAAPDRERVSAELSAALRIYNLPTSSLRGTTLRQVPERDWLREWKESWQPVAAGRFIIAPPWVKINGANNRLVIRIEPGMAFGTGTHETTRLCLKAIEKHFRGGTFLDVGTGTGILAIAAAKLFPDARIEACDTDAGALAIAQENARLNDVAERIIFRIGSIDDRSTAAADLVCANLTADVFLRLLPSLIGATCGRLILSGILDSQGESLFARLHECGVDSYEIMRDGEWMAIVV